MNFSGYAGHVTVFSASKVTTLWRFTNMLIIIIIIIMNAHYCVQFSSMVRIRIGFSVWLVNGYAHVLPSVVIVTLPD